MREPVSWRGFSRGRATDSATTLAQANGVVVIAKLHRLRTTAAEIAETLPMPLSTESGILTRIGMGWLGLEPAVRCERSRPAELVYVDVRSSAGSAASAIASAQAKKGPDAGRVTAAQRSMTSAR